MSLMSVAEAAAKPMTAYIADNGSGVVYVIDNSRMTATPDKNGSYGAFVAMRRNEHGKWEFAPDLTDATLADYSLILDYDKVQALVTEARTSLSV
jgi:hypothetical protein